MGKVGLWIGVLGIIVAGCAQTSSSQDIVRIVDFEFSPDGDKIAFSAVTPVGNTDIWVVDIDGTNLKKLTFKDRSPSNHIARFFQKHKWRNFFVVDMHTPEWTKDGRIAFCEEITKYHTLGIKTVGLLQWTINPDGSDKKIKTDRDEIIGRRKHKKEIFLRDGVLLIQ